jgi:hypothetical protein
MSDWNLCILAHARRQLGGKNFSQPLFELCEGKFLLQTSITR